MIAIVPRLSGLFRAPKGSVMPVLRPRRDLPGSEVVVLESCNSTWLFDTRRHRFRRVLKGLALDARDASTGWRSYVRLETDWELGTMTVVLNDTGTRILRSALHSVNCRRCGDEPTEEVSLEELRQLVEA
jgi:hypothetical protein